jgi:hypothetical protein
MTQSAGRKKRKGNGHKPTCGCPICHNMRKSKNGGADEEDQQGDIEEGFAPTETGESETASEEQEDESTSEDNDLSSAELGEAGPGTKAGGSRRRKRRTSKKSKKTRKSRKTRRQKKRTTRRR